MSSSICFSGLSIQCQVLCHHGQEDWSFCVRLARGHQRGEAQDGDDGVRQSHVSRPQLEIFLDFYQPSDFI